MKPADTTRPGSTNRNGQKVIGPTGRPGTDKGQSIYVLRCERCATEYGANGSDAWQRRCPACDGGAPGFAVTAADVVDAEPEPPSRNPDWSRDELILALALYFETVSKPLAKGSDEIVALSGQLNRLGEQLGRPKGFAFRNPNGVYMKLMNFRRFDPRYKAEGKVGLSRGAKGDEQVWLEFSGDLARLQLVASAIRSALQSNASGWSNFDDEIAEAVEGRLLTRVHLSRERDPALAKRKKDKEMRRAGKLACAGCGFDFAAIYGERGTGFIECHHVQAVETLALEGQRVTEDDLALVCSNCHRMIHAKRPWLTIAELQNLIGGHA